MTRHPKEIQVTRRPLLQPHGLWLAAALALAAPATWATQPPAPTTSTTTAKASVDTDQIIALLDSYTSSVSTGNRARFEQLLLDEKIPFYGLPGTLPSSFVPSLQTVQNYAGFRAAIFESGTQYAQRFFNIKIDQDGDLAQVSLNFETRVVGSDSGGQGWKILHLLKVNGHWKIASEFYTAYRLAPAGK